MARYTVQAPDGQIITLEGPDGATDAEIMEQAQRLYVLDADTKDALPEAQAQTYRQLSAAGGLDSNAPAGSPRNPYAERPGTGAPAEGFYVDQQGLVKQAKRDPLRGESYQLERKRLEEARAKGGMTALGVEAGGALSSFTSAIPFFHDASAGLQVALNPAMYKGVLGGDFTLREGYDATRELYRAQAEDFAERHPYADALTSGLGIGGSLFVPGGAATQLTARAPQGAGVLARIGASAANTARAGLTGAASGALYGAGGDGTFEERLNNAETGAKVGGVLAAATPALLATLSGRRGLRRTAPPGSTAAKAAVLEEAGVALTPGQRMGGLAKNVEDLSLRAPILGSAVSGARQRGVESLNRAVALRALEPLGERLPRNITTGFDSTRYVRERLGAAYDEAADMVPQVRVDDDFLTNLRGISERQGDLADSTREQLSRIVQDRLARFENGVTGRNAMQIADELGDLATKAQSSDDLSQRVMGDMLADVSGEIRGLIGRHNPEAAALIGQADQGYAIYARMRNAGSKGADGVFTPGQLRTAVRSEDRSVGKGRAAAGEAILQDLANASTIMPDQFGNPGTANAVGLGAGITGLFTAPGPTVAAAGGLTAAATPYFMMGRRVLDQIPQNATRAQVEAARRELERLAASDPAIRQLQEELMQRFYRLEGAAAASATAGQ